jgi:hypothetical protein
MTPGQEPGRSASAVVPKTVSGTFLNKHRKKIGVICRFTDDRTHSKAMDSNTRFAGNLR